MLSLKSLPHVIAVINAATIVVLCYGYGRIRAGDRDGHRRAMYGAIALGATFLVVYLSYHAFSGLAKFGGVGAIRPIYFTILIVHIIAAAVAAIIAPLAIFNGLRGRFETHRRLARPALPLWLFVSVSGLVVYAMTIHFFPYRG